jgi:hypothetical protein
MKLPGFCSYTFLMTTPCITLLYDTMILMGIHHLSNTEEHARRPLRQIRISHLTSHERFTDSRVTNIRQT